MSFNVYMNGYQDKEKANLTVSAIVECQADIVCLQESNSGWEDFLLNSTEDIRIRTIYPHTYFHHDMGRYGGRAILSKYPLVRKSWLPRIFPFWYGALLVTIDMPDGAQVSIMNIHLRAPFPSNPFTVQRQRLEEIETHLQRIDSLDNLLVLGDFNNGSGPSHEYLRGQRFVNALTAASSYFASKATWHWGPVGLLPFDHIYFFQESFTLKHAEVKRVGGSDHWPILAELERSSSATVPSFP